MPKDQQKHTTSRQRPVSCHFCRKRKLRCSRTAPCSNCVSRGITCDWERPIMQPSSDNSSTPSISENSEIIERLHRLENLLAVQKREEQGESDQNTDVTESQPQIIHPSVSPLQIQNIDVDSDFSRFGDVPIDQVPSVVFRICSIRQVTKAPSYINPCEIHSTTSSKLSRCIWLPSHVEAQILLEKFIRVTNHLPYVVHIPSLSSIVEEVYADLNQQRQIQWGQAVLLLSIFAAATHSWIQNDCIYGLFPTPAEPNDQAVLWVKAAEDVLNLACRLPKITIEGVQGAILVGFVAAHLDGLYRYRVLFAIGVVLARNLGLHRIDHPSNASASNTAQAEIGRRVWWYLCSSDWAMAARVGGMAEGIYSCHPRQMITKKPLNINDDELFDGMSRDERPMSQPTAMSYTMQRIRLAEISRNIVDRNPLAMAHTSGMTHDAVMDIDTELQTLINDVPEFFSMTKSMLMETYGLTESKAKIIVFQGRTTYFLLYSQRCKLHLPYFARSFEHSAYSSSREICIKYARLIIQFELWQDDLDIDCATRFKFTELLVSVFLACVILLMDLCVNPMSPQYEKQREEVYKGLGIIEEAKNESQTTAKFVDSLVRVLRKYNVSPLNPVLGQPPSQEIPRREISFGVPEEREYRDIASTRASQNQFGSSSGLSLDIMADRSLGEGADDLASYWNGFTQSFEQGIDAGSFDWDSIFLELDSSFI